MRVFTLIRCSVEGFSHKAYGSCLLTSVQLQWLEDSKQTAGYARDRHGGQPQYTLEIFRGFQCLITPFDFPEVIIHEWQVCIRHMSEKQSLADAYMTYPSQCRSDMTYHQGAQYVHIHAKQAMPWTYIEYCCQTTSMREGFDQSIVQFLKAENESALASCHCV